MTDCISRMPNELLLPMLWSETDNDDKKNVDECVESALSFAETSKENRLKMQSSFFLNFFQNKKNLFYHDPFEIVSREIPNFLSRELSFIKLQTNEPLALSVPVKKLNPKQYYLDNQVWSACTPISQVDKKLIMDTTGPYKCVASSSDFFVFNKGQTIFIYSKKKNQLETSFIVEKKIQSLGIRNGFVFIYAGDKQLSVFDTSKNEIKSIPFPWPRSSTGKIYFGSTHLFAIETRVILLQDEPRNSIYLASLDSIASCPEKTPPSLLDLKTSFYSLFVNVFPEGKNFIVVYLKKGKFKILRVALPPLKQNSIEEKPKVEVLAKQIVLVDNPMPQTKMFKDFFYSSSGELKRAKLWKIFYLRGCLFAALSKGKNLDIKSWNIRKKQIKTLFSRKNKEHNKPEVCFFSPNPHSVFLGMDNLNYDSAGKNKVAVRFEFFQGKAKPIVTS